MKKIIDYDWSISYDSYGLTTQGAFHLVTQVSFCLCYLL